MTIKSRRNKMRKKFEEEEWEEKQKRIKEE
jgi:hypothetical protein